MKNHQAILTSLPLFPQKNSNLIETKDLPSRSRKKNSLAAPESEARLVEHTDEIIRKSASLFDLVNEAIIAKTLDGTITLWNPAAERMFGYSAAEIVGQSTKVLFPFDRIKEAEEILA